MKKFLVTAGLLACASGIALAGPNAGGTLVAHDANLLMSQSDGLGSVCGQGTVPPYCSGIDTEIDGSVGADPSVFKVYAAFGEGSTPRLMGITWGITYDPGIVILPGAYGMCGSFELNDPAWPASGTGSSVTWPAPQMGLLTPVYWFMGYNYYAPDAQLFLLGPNPSPTLGGYFGDDAIPAHLDPITAFGTLGFDMPGDRACPEPPLGAACCDPATENCTLTLPADCVPPFVFHPEFTTCDPNPCAFPHEGACCFCPGICRLMTAEDCQAQSGLYLGDGTTCDPNLCSWPPISACCVGYVCTIESIWDCEQMGGTYYECTSCDPNPCPPPTPIEESTWGRIKARFR